MMRVGRQSAHKKKENPQNSHAMPRHRQTRDGKKKKKLLDYDGNHNIPICSTLSLC